MAIAGKTSTFNGTVDEIENTKNKVSVIEESNGAQKYPSADAVVSYVKGSANSEIFVRSVQKHIDPLARDFREVANFELTNETSDWVFYGNGYPNSSGFASNTNYYTYYIVAQNDFVVWADNNLYTGSNDMFITLCSSTNISDVTNQLMRTRQRKDSVDGNITTNTVPKDDSKMLVGAGQVLFVSIFKPTSSETVPPFRINVYGFSGLSSVLGENILLGENQSKRMQVDYTQFAQVDVGQIAKIVLTDANDNWVYHTNGYPDSTTGTFVENKAWLCKYITAQTDFILWTDDNLYAGSRDMILCVYNSTDFTLANRVLYSRQQKDSIDGTITKDSTPKADSKVLVKKGQIVLTSILKDSSLPNDPTFRINVSGFDGLSGLVFSDVLLNDRQIAQVQEKVGQQIDQEFTQVQEQLNQQVENSVRAAVEEIKSSEKKCCLKYGTLSQTSYHATEALYIYIPSKVGYVKYDLYHSVWDSLYVDCWRVNNVFSVDDAFVNRFALTLGGEIECAIMLDGRSDFSGGHTHGDELSDGVVFFVDGVKTDITALADYTKFSTLRIIESTRLLDPADHTTVIAKHGKEYLFDESGLTISQSVKWEVAENVKVAYMAMFTPRKTSEGEGGFAITNRAYSSTGFETIELSNPIGTPLWFPHAKKAALWAEDSGFYCSVEVTEYPTGLAGGDRMQITDNSGQNYNKVYFYVAEGYDTSVGDVWQSKVKYELEVGEGTSTNI